MPFGQQAPPASQAGQSMGKMMGESGLREGDGQRHDRIIATDDHSISIPTSDPEDEQKGDIEISLGQKMLSAVAGSILTSLLVTPLDVVRVRLQSQQKQPTYDQTRPTSTVPISRSFRNLPSNIGVTACCREVFWVTNNANYCAVESTPNTMSSPESCAVEQTQRKAFTSTFDGMRKIARNEGLTTLWRGLAPTLLMAVPGNVIYFAGYDWLRTSDKSPIKSRVSETYSPLVAGSSARVVAALFVNPIELFRTRMQASQASSGFQNFKNTLGGVREMVGNQGPLSLWRGLTLTLWRDVPFSAFYWWGYEFTRNIITDAREGERGRTLDGSVSVTRDRSDSRSRQGNATTLVDSFIAGAASGGIASVVTTPFDVGKTRQQVYRFSGDSKGSLAQGTINDLRPENSSMPRFLLHIFREEGVAGLFSGWAARTLKVAPACAIMISSYEIGKKMAQGVKDRKNT